MDQIRKTRRIGIDRARVSFKRIGFEGEFAKKVYASKKFLSPFGLMSDFNFSRRTVAGFLIDISTQIIRPSESKWPDWHGKKRLAEWYLRLTVNMAYMSVENISKSKADFAN